MFPAARATPVNRAAMARHYSTFLSTNLNNCATCHLPKKLDHPPEDLAEFPHNPFGARLRQLGKDKEIPERLRLVAEEDSDGDGVSNEVEILLGHNPGDKSDKPEAAEIATLSKSRVEKFSRHLKSYQWKPFQTAVRPPLPVANAGKTANPIDAFVEAERTARHLGARPEASKEVLLRRVWLDLIGLTPSPEEQEAFTADTSPDAYEKAVDRLLADPRYGERWGRHWMDVWRYSDWAGWADGGQVRDSKPHIWRWRDWIVESLNGDKGYDKMVVEMLAADETAPEDTDALRATGFLVRNFKLLSREQWMEDTVKHTSQAFLGLTMGCAKCHNHMYDPISQKEYYGMRAIFEPHNVRTDKIPGEPDTAKDGLARIFDADPNAPTYLFTRGDERRPETNAVIPPATPKLLGGKFEIQPVSLSLLARTPDKRRFAQEDLIKAGAEAAAAAQSALAAGQSSTNSSGEKLAELKHNAALDLAKSRSLKATIEAERLIDDGKRETEEGTKAALAACEAQREVELIEARRKKVLAEAALAAASDKLAAATKADKKEEMAKAAKEVDAAKPKFEEAQKALAAAERQAEAPLTATFKPRAVETFPATSTGRRTAFAKWVANRANPLTARVAVNHIWLRHFGAALAPSVADFGGNGRPPTHPALLDWLAVELMENGWKMKPLHRLMVTSSTYRMASTADSADAATDPDNLYFWRMNSRRMEAEAVRDNVLHVSGDLDPKMGGAEIDHKKGLESKRRSVYLRIAAEKEVEFLKIFDSPSVTECYERKTSVMPQQALALANSQLTIGEAKLLDRRLNAECGGDSARFIAEAFRRILGRKATREEIEVCRSFLKEQSAKATVEVASAEKNFAPGAVSEKARQSLLLVLFNHNDFVTIR